MKTAAPGASGSFELAASANGRFVARGPRTVHSPTPPARTIRSPRAPRFSSALVAGLLTDRSGLLTRLETLDDRVDPLRLDLFAEVRTVAVDVADTVDHHVPRLPALRRLVQVVVDGHAIAVGALHLGAHRSPCRVRIDLGGEDLEPLGGEVDQRAAVVREQ